MIRPLILLLLVSRVLAIPVSTTLTLVNEPGFNVLDITVSGPNITPDNTQCTLAGTVDAELDVDNTLARTSKLTLSNGYLTGSDFSASGTVTLSIFSGPYQLDVTGLAGTLFTTLPPGLVNAPTGEFAANQHRVVIEQGNVNGSALGQTITETFSPLNPFEGVGTGTGTVTLTPAGTTAGGFLYQVVVVLPGVNVSDSIVIGSGFTTTVTVTGTGTIKAAGMVEVPRSAYAAWTMAMGIAGAPMGGDVNHDGVPNGIAWAMGFGAAEDAGSVLPRVTGGPTPGFEIVFPPGGSVAPVWIEAGGAPDSFAALPVVRCSAGVNPLPAGTTGSVLVSASGLAREFIRLRVDE